MAAVIPTNRIFEKKSTEAFTVAVDFTDLLATADTVSSATVAATDYEHKTDVSSGGSKVIGSTTATITTPNASVAVQGGTKGRDYQISFTATTAGGDTLIIELLMRVR